jgi:hypothetical protein
LCHFGAATLLPHDEVIRQNNRRGLLELAKELQKEGQDNARP